MYKRFLATLLSISISLCQAGCDIKPDTGFESIYSTECVYIEDDTLGDIETPLDKAFKEPVIIKDRPYEFIIDYRHLEVDEDEKNKTKISKVTFEKDYSSKIVNKRSNEFFKDYCLKYIELQDNKELDLNMLLDKNIIDIDLKAIKLVNNEDAVYYLKSIITFNKDYNDIQKGSTISQDYVLSSDGKLLALNLNEFGSFSKVGSLDDAIVKYDLLGLYTNSIFSEELPALEEELYFMINDLKKDKKI